jgi:hypothetical protein
MLRRGVATLLELQEVDAESAPGSRVITRIDVPSAGATDEPFAPLGPDVHPTSDIFPARFVLAGDSRDGTTLRAWTEPGAS